MEAEVVRMVAHLFNGGSNACGVSVFKLNMFYFTLIKFYSQLQVAVLSQFYSHVKLIVIMVVK